MKVARTLTIFLALVALVVMGGLTLVLVSAELGHLADDMEQDHFAIANALAPAVAAHWAHSPDEARAMLERGNGTVELHLRDGAALERLQPADRVVLETRRQVSFELGGERQTWVRVPVEEPTLYLEVRESIAPHYQWVNQTMVKVLVSALALLLTFIVVAAITGRWLIGAPVQALVAFAARVGAGDFGARVALVGRGELAELGRQLDSMAVALAQAQQRVELEATERHAAEERLHHADRLSTVGKLAAGIAHELGTPLSVVATWGRMITSGEADADEARRGGAIVADQAGVMTRIIRQLLDFARRRRPERSELDADALLESTARLVGPLASRRDVTLVHAASPAPVLVAADSVQLQQVLTNLVMNAVQAMPGKGEVRLWADTVQRPAPADVERAGAPRAWVVLHVRDTGSGIAPDVLPHVFEPFFTTKDVGEGTGLGLSVSWSLVRDHDGWIEVSSEVGAGSHFAVYLPCS
jgi:signal transduction histidine kinase